MLISAITRLVHFSIRRPWLVMALAARRQRAVGALRGAQFRHQHRHQQADFTEARLAAARTDLRARVSRTARHHADRDRDTERRAVARSPPMRSNSASSGRRACSRRCAISAARSSSPATACCFSPRTRSTRTTQGLAQSGQLIGVLAGDPSLRGLHARAVVRPDERAGRHGEARRPRPPAHDVGGYDRGVARRQARELLLAGAADRRHPDRPVTCDASSRSSRCSISRRWNPGRPSTDAIRKAVDELGLAEKYQARVRLTGQVPMADDEFSTVKHGAMVNGIATVVVVLIILWLALRSGASSSPSSQSVGRARRHRGRRA